MKTQIKLLVIILANVFYSKIFSQVDQSGFTGHYRTNSAFYVGWDGINGSSGPLEIRNDWSDHINFYTNGSQRMTILGNNTVTGTTAGNVGIGTTSPTQSLQVNGGNIDIYSSNNSYMIGGYPVLWCNQDPSNIFVGSNVGLSNSFGLGIYNTEVGFYSGNANTVGSFNTFLGSYSGSSNVSGYENTDVGFYAGDDNTTGYQNVCIGYLSGDNNLTGHHNTFLGYSTAVAAQNLTNVTAIGSYAYVSQDNSIVLGSINGVNGASANTNVGIGTTAPTALFEVKNNSTYTGVLSTTALSSGLANYAVLGHCNSTSSLFNIGVAGTQNASSNILNIGVLGSVSGVNLYNMGGAFIVNTPCTPNVTNYGVYAKATTCDPTMPPTNATGYAGYFNGLVYLTEGFITSDNKLKDSVTNIGNALSVISLLHPKSFTFKRDSFPSMILPYGTQYGVIAQEIDTLLPSLVTNVIEPQEYDSAGTLLFDSVHFKAVNYTGLIPFCIAGIQELDSIKVSSVATKADSNRVVKWSNTDKALVNSQFYDDGLRVGLPSTDPEAYLNVVNTDTATIAGKFEGGKYGVKGICSGNKSTNVGVLGKSTNATEMNIGVMGNVETLANSVNVGVGALATQSSNANIGVLVSSEYVNSASVNVGVLSYSAGSANQNQGGHFEAYDTTGTNYGIFAYANGTAPTAYAGYFDGDVHATGTVTWTSDAALKDNITKLNPTDALASLQRLEPKTYTFKNTDYPFLSLPKGKQYGLIAQDVQQVFPDLVTDITQPERIDKNGKKISPSFQYKGLNYVGLIPLLISAVKQQQTTIDSLGTVINDRLAALESRVTACCGAGSSGQHREYHPADSTTGVNHLSVELGNLQVVVLEQNVPNPFADQTTISYFIPDGTAGAQMLFTDLSGNIIKTVDIQSGHGMMTVFASNLSGGQYAYTLLVNGKAIETRRMIKGK
jgi:hypothetical protein